MLLVDGEQHLAVTDRRQDRGGEIEGAELDLAKEADLLERGQRRLGAGRPQGENAFGVRILAEEGQDGVAGLGRVHRDGEDRNLAAEAVLEALAAQIEGDVADLLVDAHRLGDAGLLHLLAAAKAGLVLGLADVHQGAELLADIAAGVHRHHGNAGGDRPADGVAKRLGVRDRNDEPVGFRGHRRVDQQAHRDHVEGVGRTVRDLDAHVLLGGVDAVLDHRPERVGGLPVADDDEAKLLRGRRPDCQSRRHDGREQQFSEGFHLLFSHIGNPK